jgi:hypothetical protein
MNFDDEGLWFGLHQALLQGLKQASFKQTIKLLTVLDNIEPKEGEEGVLNPS